MISRTNPRRRDEIQEEAGCRNHSASTPVTEGSLFISVKAVEWVLENSESSGNPRNVLTVLAAHCTPGGYAWPSLNTICELSNLSKPAVLQCFEKLISAKELRIEKGGNGAGDTNYYHLTGFIEKRVKKGKVLQNKSKVEADLRVKPVESEEPRKPERLQRISEEIEENSQAQNKKYLEEERAEEPLPLKQEERKALPKPVKEPKVRRGFEKPSPRPVASPRVVTNKQPESWIWFSKVFKRLADVNAVTMKELWVLVDEMQLEIGREEAEERLSIYLDGLGKVSGFAAKDFLEGGWRTIDPEEHHLPRIVNEGI